MSVIVKVSENKVYNEHAKNMRILSNMAAGNSLLAKRVISRYVSAYIHKTVDMKLVSSFQKVLKTHV